MAKKINRKVKWAEGGAVKMAAGGSAALALIEQMRRAGAQSQEFDPVLVSMREQRARPARRSAAPPLTAMQAPQTREEPLPLPPMPPAMRPDENPPPEAPRNPMRFDEGNPHVATAIRMAQRYNLPTNVFLSLIEQESGFNPAARSRVGAIGLGQLMPGTAAELRVNPLDPEQNLEGSARYLRKMLDEFGTMELALAAYNAGPGRVRRAGNTIPNIRETREYVPSVLRRAGASVPEGYAEGGLAELDQKYAEGGRVGRVAGAIGRAVRGRREPAENPQAVTGVAQEVPEVVESVALSRPTRSAAEPSVIEDWQWRPNEDVMRDLNLREIPEHVQDFGQFMRDQAERAGGGDMGIRDLQKAFAITRASIQRRALPADRIRDAGLSLPDVDGLIRPEGAMAEWLGTPMGQRYLDAAGRGVVDEEAIANAMQVMRPFGKHNDLGDALRYGALELPGREVEASAAISNLYRDPAAIDQWRDFGKSLRGIGPSKQGFVGSLLGAGADPTLDARQIILHTGRPTSESGRYIARRGGLGGDQAVGRLALRQKEMELSLPEELRPFYQHLAHHAVWDRAGNEITTHADVMRAMRNYGIIPGAIAAGTALSDGESPASLEDLDQKYAEGGAVMSDEEYDRRLLSRMKAQTGRVTEPTRAEQMQALRTAGREAAEGVADVLLPQSPLDFALMAAFGPGGRAARLAGSAALASLEPSEAEASRFRRLIRAYHGSPHKFDEFDIRKIGTGEGAQAYGRGLYFADNEDIAKYYRNKLTEDSFVTPEGTLWSPESLQHLNVRVAARRNPEDLDVAIQRGEDLLQNAPTAIRDLLESDLNALRTLRDAGGVSRNPGYMYEVDLNADPRDFLNWDLPLSQQSREVRESIRSASPSTFEYVQSIPGKYGDAGGFIYDDIVDQLGGHENARLALMQAGIPGTRYLDAGSRGVGGTYNYAVFDPEIIDIQRRYAQGGLAELDQKYAEGGIVAAEPAKYDPDAVDALVKQIEAEYV